MDVAEARGSTLKTAVMGSNGVALVSTFQTHPSLVVPRSIAAGQAGSAVHAVASSYGRKLWMSLSHENAAYLPP
jgi:hypothetical protein